MNTLNNTQDLFDFIERCPTAYQTVATLRETLLRQGFAELEEHSPWTIKAGGDYFVTRGGSSIIAFRIPADPASATGYQIMATHSDSPSFKLKPSFEKKAEGNCLQWNVERYGGMICSSWMDRPLSVAGRVVLSDEGGIRTVSVHIHRDLALIPNVAIHMDRSVNEGKKFNPQVDMLPLAGLQSEQNNLMQVIADELGINVSDIVSHDLFLYVRDAAKTVGINGEFICAPRLDDLMCTWAALQGFLACQGQRNAAVLAVFDNEEIGSSSRQGAASSLLRDTLTRVDDALYAQDVNGLKCRLANSVLISADNAHAVHPNHPEYADANNRPTMGGGIVIKYNAEQRYATDAVSAAVFTHICDKAGVRTQAFANRSDIRGGSTLGNIAVSDLPALTVDIGLAQLAMHSAYETASADDLVSLIKASKAFYRSAVTAVHDGQYRVDTKQ